MGNSNPKLKPLGMAFGASAIAAIGTMFLPVSLLEGITGASGLSEIVPATAAPLGDTARALIAFGAGAFTLAVMAIILLRKDRDIDAAKATTPAVKSDIETKQEPSAFLDGLQERLMNFKLPQMPWAKKNDDDILDLADLPKLRSMDAHPDAPARRPFSAGSDLGLDTVPAPQMAAPARPQAAPSDLRFWPERQEDETQIDVNSDPVFVGQVAELAQQRAVAEDVVSEPAAATPAVVSAPASIMSPEQAEIAVPVQAEPSLTDLVTQLQRSVQLRQQQLSALEMVAAQIKSEAAAAASAVAVAPVAAMEEPLRVAEPRAELAADPVVEPVAEQPVVEQPVVAPRAERPPLEAVFMPERRMADDDMDSALNAALETLQRMNAQAR